MTMLNAKETLDMYYLEMRWRCLSLAADLDRVQRASGGAGVLKSDPRLASLRNAIALLMEDIPNRAEKIQDVFSDKTPPPAVHRKSQISDFK
jgi:hypothetical protein